MEQKQKINTEQFEGQATLPKFAIPSHDLHIKLDPIACNFFGTIDINLNIIEKTNFSVLNALELEVHEVLFTSIPTNNIVRVMLLWTKMMKYLSWSLMDHLLLEKESWGSIFLGSLMST